MRFWQMSSSLAKRTYFTISNITLHIIHLSVICFSVFGWVFDQTRSIHLILQALIFFSWFGLGLIKGWGYCLITDLQWKLKRSANIIMDSESYVKWLIDELFSTNIPENTTNIITMFTFFFTSIVSAILYYSS